MSDARLTISVEDAARLLGISRGLAYEAARRGQLPVMCGRARFRSEKNGLVAGLSCLGALAHGNERRA
jgi:hypothetical protein